MMLHVQRDRQQKRRGDRELWQQKHRFSARTGDQGAKTPIFVVSGGRGSGGGRGVRREQDIESKRSLFSAGVGYRGKENPLSAAIEDRGKTSSFWARTGGPCFPWVGMFSVGTGDRRETKHVLSGDEGSTQNQIPFLSGAQDQGDVFSGDMSSEMGDRGKPNAVCKWRQGIRNKKTRPFFSWYRGLEGVIFGRRGGGSGLTKTPLSGSRGCFHNISYNTPTLCYLDHNPRIQAG